MKRPFVSMAAVALLSAACVLTPLASAAEETTAYIDNSALIPKIVDDSQVVMEDSGNGLMSPDWVKTLIIGEITIARCTPEGTFQAAVKVLDHYQEMGINGLWLTPCLRHQPRHRRPLRQLRPPHRRSCPDRHGGLRGGLGRRQGIRERVP